MSEYQFIHFRALDGPLSDEQLALMERQSTRAHVTRWEFTNEYHFGDFRGDVKGMLRNGYDVHLHFANFGIRRLMFRLPAGLPCDPETFKAFVADDGMAWHADKQGEGGILEICPEGDADAYDSYLEDLDSVLEDVAPLRDALMAGDLRPLYLAWLACCGDDDAMEPPVPAGLGEMCSPPKAGSGGGAAQATVSAALEAMAAFYEISGNLLDAAAEHSPPLPERFGQADALAAWVAGQSKPALQALVLRLLDDHAAARADVLARVRGQQGAPAWPMAEPARTLGDLRAAVGRARQQQLQRRKKAEAAARRKRLAGIAKNPEKVVASVHRLVAERSGNSYKQAARELAELREALGPEKGPDYVQAVAGKLHADNPRRYSLIAALRDEALLE